MPMITTGTDSFTYTVTSERRDRDGDGDVLMCAAVNDPPTVVDAPIADHGEC